MKNVFCNLSDLRNEASVEALFVDRLLNWLGYPDNKIRRKESLEKIVIGKGSRKEKYRPDYVLLDSTGNPIVVLDAKAPNEDLNEYNYQVSSYALHLNQRYTDKNPVLYTILTNGHQFIVCPWDSNQPVFYLRFEEFHQHNEKFLELRSNLAFSAFKQIAATKDVFDFRRPGLTELIKTFYDCHNLIWKKEKISPTDAFYEFSKIMFIKIREDNRIHAILDREQKPKTSDFIFSTNWIEAQAKVELNPVDSILFRQIQQELERQIIERKKKRIFPKNEGLNLKATTTFEVVKKLQKFDLYGIDEDLNGRMFETFLNATVRGKDLGQFFTPRGVVHYMVETAPLFVSSNKRASVTDNIPLILDGCCGSGGFLIDAMAQLVKSINNLTSLTNKERETYIEETKNNHLYGVDANEKIARISRLNMYLHGDGGSKIFKCDTLDKELIVEPGMSDEEQSGVEELRNYLTKKGLLFDVVLTNPPFSMRYQSSDKHESRILSQYSIAKTESGAQSSSEKSNILFIERYMDLLKPGTGELLTVIDDTVLNGDSSQSYRDFIFDNFIVVQVVSLPFNTFFRADANVKTSLVHLRRKKSGEQQGNIFMAITNNIGHDDHSYDTPERNNLTMVAEVFEKWRNGERIQDQIIHNESNDEPLGCPLQIFEVKKEDIRKHRLDAFYYSCEMKTLCNRMRELEMREKIQLFKGEKFSIIPELRKSDIDEMKKEKFKYFEIGDVSIDGTILKYREDYFENLPTRARLMVKAGDVIFAKNNSSRGTTVIIPNWFDGGLVTTGFIGIRPKDYEEALVLWNVLESDFFKKQVYYYAITASQPEIRENIFQSEMLIPWPKSRAHRKSIIDNAKLAEQARTSLNTAIRKASDTFDGLIKD